MLPSHLGTGDKSILEELESIRNGGKDEWVVYHANGKNGELVKDDSGKTVADFVYCFDGDKVQMAYLRYEMSQTKKFLCVCWCGQGCPDTLRTKFPAYARDWEDFLKKNKHSISVVIQARKEEDIEESVIVDKLNKATNTFVRAKRTGEEKENLNAKTQNFWNQQKVKDQQFEEENAKKKQEMEKQLLESREREIQKKKAAGQEYTQRLVQEKEEKANQFKRQQQERDQAEQARWKKENEELKKKNEAHYQQPMQYKNNQEVKGNVSSYANRFSQAAEEANKPSYTKVAPTGKKWTPHPVSQPVQEQPKPAPRTFKYQQKAAQPQPQEQQYEEPPQEQQYEEPPQEQQYEEPPQEQQYEEPPQEQQYEEPPQEEPPQEEQQYEEPPQEEPPQEQYEEPPQEEPPQEQYEEPPQEEPPQEEPPQEEPPQEQYEEPPQEEPPQEPQGDMYIADYDYDGEQDGDLPFKEGEVLEVISVDEDGWGQAKNSSGQVGTVPMNYLRKQ